MAGRMEISDRAEEIEQDAEVEVMEEVDMEELRAGEETSAFTLSM